MTGDLALAARLVRGAGRSDVVRLALMTVGIALSVAAVLVAVAIPRGLGGAEHRAAERLPVWGAPPVGALPLHVETVESATDGRVWTQVRLSGGDLSAPVPPGLGALPAPGHTVVSPALRSLLAQDPRLATALGVVDVVVLTDDGLTRPDELVSYTRIPAATASSVATPPVPSAAAEQSAPDVAPPTDAVIAFGDRSRAGGLSTSLGLEAMVLVAVPALLFLSVCSRLSVTSRRARLQSLRLIGVSRDRCARIFSRELAIVSAVGAAAGVCLFEAIRKRLAGGLLGVTWFTDDTEIGWQAVVLLVLLTVFATAAVSRRTMRRMLTSGSGRHRRPWIARSGGVAASLGMAFLVVVAVKSARAGADEVVLPPDLHVPLVLGACVLAVLGLLLWLPLAMSGLGQRLSVVDLPLSVRLGARQSAVQTSLGSRLIAALVATVVVAGLSSAFLRSVYLDGIGDPDTAVLNVDLHAATEKDRRALARELPTSSEIFLVATLAGTENQAFVHVMPCESYVRRYGPTQRPCVPGPVRVGGTSPTSPMLAGAAIQVPQVSGAPLKVPAPAASLDGNDGQAVVFPLADAPWAVMAPDATVSVTAPVDASASEVARLQSVAPSAIVQRVVKDPASLARFVEQTAVLHSSLALAFLLCLLTFVFTMVEARWAAARTRVAQRALGVPIGVTQRAAMVQAALPVAVGLVVVVPAVVLARVDFLTYWGAGRAWDWSLWTLTASMSCAALVLTAAVGYLSGRSPLRLEVLVD